MQVDHLVVLCGQVVPGALQVRNLRAQAAWAVSGRAGQDVLPGCQLAAPACPPSEGSGPGGSSARSWAGQQQGQRGQQGAAGRACLHEVAGHQGLADVGVVVAAVEVGGAELHLEPRADAHLAGVGWGGRDGGVGAVWEVVGWGWGGEAGLGG